MDIGAIINRELKNRLRPIHGIGQHKTIVRNDLRLISKVIKQLDERWNIWGSIDQTQEDQKVAASAAVPSSTDDSEISSSTTKNKNPTGFLSYNPLLKNITEYLVEEGDAEEEESNVFETDPDLNKVG